MDAVLYPNIYEHEEIFWQEGWSYKLDSADDKLAYNGVVYNEKGSWYRIRESVSLASKASRYSLSSLKACSRI